MIDSSLVPETIAPGPSNGMNVEHAGKDPQAPHLPLSCCGRSIPSLYDQRRPNKVSVVVYKPPRTHLPLPHFAMNLKSLAALTLAASAAPLAVAGPLAYGLCQTGAYL